MANGQFPQPRKDVVAGLVAGVDTQDNGFYVEIRFIGSRIDLDSSNILLTYPDEKDAEKNVKGLFTYLTGKNDQT